MKKQFFFRCDEQQNLIRELNLTCKREIGLTTYMYKISEDEETHFIIILSLRDDGTIIQKWHCVPDVAPTVMYENTSIESNQIECPGPGAECDDIMDENNIKCYLCEQKVDDVLKN